MEQWVIPAKSPQPLLSDSLRYAAQHRIYLTQHLCFPVPASSVIEEFRAAHFAAVLDGFRGFLPVLLEGCLSALILWRRCGNREDAFTAARKASSGLVAFSGELAANTPAINEAGMVAFYAALSSRLLLHHLRVMHDGAGTTEGG